MILTIKHKFGIYRRFELDIWGLCYTDTRAKAAKKGIDPDRIKYFKSPYLKFFYKLYDAKQKFRELNKRRYIYRLDIMPVYRKIKKFKKRFVSIRVTRLYFLTFQDYQFRKLFRRASKMDGNMELNYCHLLEGRLLAIVYRTNLLNNMFEIIRYIRHGNVFVDFQCIRSVNFPVPVGKILTFSEKTVRRIRVSLKRRLKLWAVLFNVPRFLFMSYQLMFGYLMRTPLKKDLIYPISIDIQRITGYY